MSEKTIWIVGGEPAIAGAVEEAARESQQAARRVADGEPVPARDGDSLVDLGIPPSAAPEASLETEERRRAERIVAAAPSDARLVRVSVIGARAGAKAELQRAAAAAENVFESVGSRACLLRVGLLLGACGFAQGLRRAIERSPVLVLPGIDRARLEPLSLHDLARYCVAAATREETPGTVYDLGCGELVTGGLLVKTFAETLGHGRLLVPGPRWMRSAVAPGFATSAFPAASCRRFLEALAGGLLPRRLDAWKHFDIEPKDLRGAVAEAAGMDVIPRRREESRFSGWRSPTKRGILWRKK